MKHKDALEAIDQGTRTARIRQQRDDALAQACKCLNRNLKYTARKWIKIADSYDKELIKVREGRA